MANSDERLAALETEMLGPAKYVGSEVAEAAGVTIEQARSMWRAMGFPDPSPTDVIFTDLDVRVLRSTLELAGQHELEYPVVVQAARAIGQALSRVAESEVSMLADWLDVRANGDHTAAELDQLLDRAVRTVLLERDEEYITYAWRRHLAAAIARQFTDSTGLTHHDLLRAVGFADLVGFSAFSQEADSQQLATVMDRFENLAYDRVAAGGGRVIKMIGDEVFFAVDDPVAAAEIGLDLADAYSDDDLLPDVRLGLAYGGVISRGGDLFGPAVNLASRLVNMARPGSVLISASLCEALEEHPAVATKQLRRLRALKGIGRVPVYHLMRVPVDNAV